MTKEEIKTKWLEELRSGNHHQITETLKDQFGNGEYGYCCLGVLAEKVMDLDVRIAYEDVLDDEGDLEIYEEVNNLLGKHLSAECSQNNDGGWTFIEIADLIERKWEV